MKLMILGTYEWRLDLNQLEVDRNGNEQQN
jgi:hypothetical protein